MKLTSNNINWKYGKLFAIANTETHEVMGMSNTKTVQRFPDIVMFDGKLFITGSFYLIERENFTPFKTGQKVSVKGSDKEWRFERYSEDEKTSVVSSGEWGSCFLSVESDLIMDGLSDELEMKKAKEKQIEDFYEELHDTKMMEFNRTFTMNMLKIMQEKGHLREIILPLKGSK